MKRIYICIMMKLFAFFVWRKTQVILSVCWSTCGKRDSVISMTWDFTLKYTLSTCVALYMLIYTYALIKLNHVLVISIYRSKETKITIYLFFFLALGLSIWGLTTFNLNRNRLWDLFTVVESRKICREFVYTMSHYFI